MTSHELADLNLDPGQPLQSQLYRQLVRWICVGRLAAGTKLPSSRRLAESLAISRNTVTQVLDQMKAEGFLTSYPGKGVFVSPKLPSYVEKPEGQDWQAQSNRCLPPLSDYGDLVQAFPGSRENEDLLIPFTPGLPDLNAFPFTIWNKLYRRHQSRLALAGYGQSQGYLPLRQALAEYLRNSRGLRCNAEQVIITNGAQEALNLCAQVTVNRGDRVYIENPGYRRARSAFLAVGAKLMPVSLADKHLDVDKLVKSAKKAKLLFITPTHQYPMGGVMPASERIKLLDWATQMGCWIIEDDYDSEFSFQNKPVAALQGMGEKTPVLYMGSFSKTLLPGLRLGYLVTPSSTVPAFAQAKEMLSGHSPLVTQAVVADFLNEGHFVRHLQKMRASYMQKWEHFCQLIRDTLPSPARLIASSTGMHLVISTPGHDDITLSKKLRSHGLGSTPLSLFFPNKVENTGLVLGFANTEHKQREECVKVLTKLLEK
ncbi:PLP-dependent aminotransferase family protein [Microbulbifer sp. A4B17]|uniref:MocR-like pyridoxine biosynthesis transcription factor PdxR n=1 Tax=Microbulbifer sp. A4B17 TaxID=359370 RepID=UPI00192D8126|nr:PLP-dependent aminotransferase family protein [Microbulbifer sp. A4B17]